MCVCVCVSRSVVSDSLRPSGAGDSGKCFQDPEGGDEIWGKQREND